VSSIPATSPGRMDIVYSGDSLLVNLPDAVGVIDLTSSTLSVSRIEIPSLDRANAETTYDIAAASNQKVFVSMQGNVMANFRLLEIDLPTGQQRPRAAGGLGGRLARSHHGAFVVNNYSRLQTYAIDIDSFYRSIPSLNPGFPPAMNRTGDAIAV